jgi:hypothetical protein
MSKFAAALSFVLMVGCVQESEAIDRGITESGLLQMFFDKIRKDDLPKKIEKGEDPQEEWSSLVEQWRKEFIRCFLDKKSVRIESAWWVSQLGKHGPETDLKLLLAFPEIMFVMRTPRIWVPKKAKPTGDKRWDAAVAASITKLGLVESEVRRAMVMRLLQDPVLLRRYYQSNMWSGKFLLLYGETSSFMLGYTVNDLIDGFKPYEKADKEYWCHALMFMLLAHATHRDDLLVNASPEDLYVRFATWKSWILSGFFTISALPAERRWRLEQNEEMNKKIENVFENAEDREEAILQKWQGCEGEFAPPSIGRMASPFLEWPLDITLPPEPARIIGEFNSSECFQYFTGQVYRKMFGEPPPVDQGE